MSFPHRFGVGVAGSLEDPYIPPFCDSCNADLEDCSTCETYRDWAEKQFQAMKALEEKHQPFKEASNDG